MISDSLKSVINFFEQARQDYKYASDQLDICDKETQDIRVNNFDGGLQK